ncbi:uncharacterized protein LOC119081647 [Bradysia coprophila]|uniref:uncharacterized protein LOC119081647 n=1 Tax=Bradysia coprophila TaxID=38358 RepID=UPI00187D7983|nr:uncharacterized protein LOC119081647 [Bradysia coprophila]
MFLRTHLAKLTRPLYNQFKSVMSFGDSIASSNAFVRSASNMTAVQLPDMLLTKRRPELSLKFDPRTRKLSLQLGDQQLGSTPNQTNSKFCSYCNAPQCKLLAKSSEKDDANNELSKNDDRKIVTISIDREAFCRAICNSPESGSPTGKTEAVTDGEYCQYCNAPKCKLTAKQTDNVRSIEESTEYCELCKAPKCKLEEKLAVTPVKNDVDVRSENPNKIEKGFEYCKYCDAPKCKLTEKFERLRSDVNAKSSEGSSKTKTSLSKKRNKYSDTSRNTDEEMELSNDVTKGPHYCSVCKSPICKFELPQTTQTENDVENISDTSKSSDKISITLNPSEICATICAETSKNASVKPIMNSPEKRLSRSNKFNASYDKDNSKI